MSLLHCPAGLCERMLVAIQQRTSRGVCGLLSGNIAGSAMIKFDCHNAQIRQACVQWLHAFSRRSYGRVHCLLKQCFDVGALEISSARLGLPSLNLALIP